MTSTTTKEASITVSFKHVWNVDQETLEKFKKGETIDSPLFGPDNFDMIKFKWQLTYNAVYANPCRVSLILVSSFEKTLDLKLKIVLKQPSNIGLYEMDGNAECNIRLYIEHPNTIGIFENILTKCLRHESIQCEFELEFPCKLAIPLLKLANDLNCLRMKSRYTDVTFVVGTKEYPANKNILSARSTVFEVMFSREEFLENQQNRVDITDIDEKVFEALLDFIYTSQVKQLDEIASELLVAAHKYEIESLVELCVQSMLKTINTNNAINYLLHAKMYNLTELKRKAIDLINRNAGKVIKSEDWLKRVQPDNSLMIELYRDLVEKHPKT